MAKVEASSASSVIGPQMTVRGVISGEENMTVHGRIEGNVNLEAELHVTTSAVLEADLEVHRVEVLGQIRGDISASDTIRLHAGSSVIGTIRAPEIIVDDGASFRGVVDMDVALPAEFIRDASS